VTPLLVTLAVLVVAGAVAAVAAATPRLAVLGLFVALVGAAYVAEPVPGPVGLIARLAGSTLGTFLVWIALRRAPAALPPSSAGWAGAGAIAAAAFVAGWLAASGLGQAMAAGAGPGDGPGTGGVGAALVAGSPVAHAAVAAAFALTAVALPQVVLSRDTLRLGTGCLLLLAAAGLVANALVGELDPVVQLALALLTALAGAGAAVLIATSIRHGGDLDIRDGRRADAVIRSRTADDAHRSAHPVVAPVRASEAAGRSGVTGPAGEPEVTRASQATGARSATPRARRTAGPAS
jgi:hypothetical protein